MNDRDDLEEKGVTWRQGAKRTRASPKKKRSEIEGAESPASALLLPPEGWSSLKESLGPAGGPRGGRGTLMPACRPTPRSLAGPVHANSLQLCPALLRPHGLQPTRLLCPWDSPGKNTGVGCHALLQGIFPTQGSNPRALHCTWILYC